MGHMDAAGGTVRSRAFRAVAWAGVVLFGAIAVGLIASAPLSSKPWGNTLGAGAFSAVTALVFGRMTRMRLDFDRNGVTLVRLLGSRHVDWADLTDVRVDRSGVHLVLITGEDVDARALGKSQWATWRGRTTDVDRAVERLRHEASFHRSDAP